MMLDTSRSRTESQALSQMLDHLQDIFGSISETLAQRLELFEIFSDLFRRDLVVFCHGITSLNGYQNDETCTGKCPSKPGTFSATLTDSTSKSGAASIIRASCSTKSGTAWVTGTAWIRFRNPLRTISTDVDCTYVLRSSLSSGT